ncbi:hypothetical protein RhiirA5_399080 [Rhizophagus irregularis]|uniref:Uncharacterized protein n=1 Tax=Rhizophagus irregularis TaxID=588596 RepID=A0A2N0PPP3_9GLOM|nr:hypothetical protein RhiirA5_399080 [Rhizophagus irregularis]
MPKDKKTIKNTSSQQLIVPFRLHMRVFYELNGEIFIISIIQNTTSPFELEFVCTCKEKSTEISSSASTAITTLYQEIFGKRTEYSGPAIMGFYNDQIIERLLQNVTFFPIYIKIQSFLVVVSNIGYSKNNGCCGAGNGFTSSILTKFQKKHSFVSQRIENNTCILRIYHESNIVAQFEDETPTNVWKKSGINKKFDGIDLFGITHSSVQTILQNPPKNNILRICTVDEWNNFEILQQAFDRHIKSRKTGKMALLDNWQTLQNIYPVDYQIHHKKLCAWKAMLIACGCTNVTPFEKKESNIEFWSRAMDPSADKETLLNLYNAGLICLKNNTPIIIDKSMNFWESFKSTLDNNRRDIDGKIRILSIIAENFRYNDLRKKLQVSPNTINSARKYARLNSPGAIAIDKSNVTMSSYKVDSKTNLPILYLQDQKEALWTKFEEIYPNGMKKTSFIARLADCSHIKYQEDMGELCLICNDYGFEAF